MLGCAGGVLMFVLLRTSCVRGYNLDTKFAIVYESSPGDYFGYTVALHRNREGSLALIGAPRANSSFLPVHQPGVLFKCNVPLNNAKPRCSEVVLDPRGNTHAGEGNEFSYYDKKDDMWLGVSLDIQQDKAHNDIVTCGHLWKNQLYRSHHLANGVCYVINSDLDQSSVVKLVPLIERSKQAIIPPGIYYFAFGQAGTSVAFSENGKHLLLGAPGIYDWVGSVVSYSSDGSRPRSAYTHPIIPDPPTGISPESYLGYSVTSGKFFDNNDEFFAVGAPRDNGNHGRVYIFKALEQKKKELFVHQKKEGHQFGEYFGASVLGVNLNGDSFTDLLVGAPFHSLETGGDEGKVYVYISNGVGLQAYAELMGSAKPNSRFGTAFANVGDLNQDGFNDIAVGAPYEDKGAIYIYHGSEAGLKVQYVQKIEAADINSELSGFGIHISRGLDIDSNQYPDVLVGSYDSSHAVLFRARPVIQLFPKLVFSPKQVNMNQSTCEFQGGKQPCVNVTACLWYVGKHLNLPLDFETEIHVEHPSQSNLIYPRGFFDQNGRQATVIRENATLNIGTERCTRHVLYIHPNIKDIITPIQILFRYRLAEPANAGKFFHKSFPVIHDSSPTNITSAVTFQTGCGREDRCLSDLVVSAKLLGSAESGKLILGELSSISLAITVKNRGEPAYSSELLIFLPPDMPSINQDICTSSGQNSNASLVCELGNPLLENVEVTILIKLDVTKIPIDRKAMDIILEARTVSTEEVPEDNDLRIPLELQAVADISITGISSQEQILYDEDEPVEYPVPIVHTYTVRNYGPSPLQVIDILLYVPMSFSGPDGKMQFLSFTSLEVDSGKQLTIPAKCNDTYIDLKSVAPDVKHNRGQAFGEDDLVAQNSSARRHYNHSSDYVATPSDTLMDAEEEEEAVIIHRSKKSVDKGKAGTPKTRETISLNCGHENVECIAIQCTASPFTDTRKIAQITVAAQVNLTILNYYLGPWYRVELVSSGHVSMRDVSSNVEERHIQPNDAWVKTVFVHKGPPPSEELALWIIFVSIGAGILLLLIILILLIRFGFFKREKKEQMEKMLNSESKDYEHLEEPNEKDALNH